jgi:hypothetical protein
VFLKLLIFHHLRDKERTMRTIATVALISGVLAAMALWSSPGAAAEKAVGGKIYEMRVYKANPGKFEAMHARFRDHTCKLFQKHGIELVGFWTPTQGGEAKTTLIYILAYPNAAAQKKMWQAFLDDPVWKKVKEESEKDGVLVGEIKSTLMKATDYSPMR